MKWNEYWPEFDEAAPLNEQHVLFTDLEYALRKNVYSIGDIKHIGRWRLYYGNEEYTTSLLTNKGPVFSEFLLLYLFGMMRDGSWFFLIAKNGFEGWGGFSDDCFLVYTSTPFQVIQQIPDEIRHSLFPELYNDPFVALPKGFMPWDYDPAVGPVTSMKGYETSVGYVDEFSSWKNYSKPVINPGSLKTFYMD